VPLLTHPLSPDAIHAWGRAAHAVKEGALPLLARLWYAAELGLMRSDPNAPNGGKIHGAGIVSSKGERSTPWKARRRTGRVRFSIACCKCVIASIRAAHARAGLDDHDG